MKPDPAAILSVSFTPNVSAIFGVLDMKTEANVVNGLRSVGGTVLWI